MDIDPVKVIEKLHTELANETMARIKLQVALDQLVEERDELADQLSRMQANYGSGENIDDGGHAGQELADGTQPPQGQGVPDTSLDPQLLRGSGS